MGSGLRRTRRGGPPGPGARGRGPPAAGPRGTRRSNRERTSRGISEEFARVLREKPLISFEEKPQVRKSIEKQGDAVDAAAESESRIRLRVDSRPGENARMDAAGPHDLDPAGALALAAARALAEDAAHVDVRAGLDEGEKRGDKACPGLRTEELRQEGF